MVTIRELKERIARAQAELTAVSTALEELARSPIGTPSDASLLDSQPSPPGETLFSDPRVALADLDRALAQMGIDVSQPALTPEAVQELMQREGVRPEDCLLSRGIIEAREE